MADAPTKRYQTPEEVLQDGIQELERPLGRSWVPWTVGIAAIALLIAIVGAVMSWEHRQARAELAVANQVSIRLGAPRGEISSTPRSFEWSPVEGAASYVVSVREASGDIVLTRRSAGSVLVPVDFETALLGAGDYAWTVEALGSSGERLGRGEGTFRISAFTSVEPPVE